jgi:murein DD-endopeptidase MepM/ murein hydrolase activator NlpD
MKLKNYVLNGPRVVILADGRDPFTSWIHHLDRTFQLRGGVDLVAQVGTPVYAPTAGTMHHLPNNGGAGNSSRFKHDANPGWADVFSHLSGYIGRDGQHFAQGQLIAYSGNSGNVDQHLHRHLLDPRGIRRNPWAYFPLAAPAALPSTPIEETMTAADIAAINAHTTAETERLLVTLQSTVRREVRGRLYRNLDTDEVVVCRPTTGFWFPLSDPRGWEGQLESLRVNPYQLIASDEVIVNLHDETFRNLKDITDGHLARVEALAT